MKFQSFVGRTLVLALSSASANGLVSPERQPNCEPSFDVIHGSQSGGNGSLPLLLRNPSSRRIGWRQRDEEDQDGGIIGTHKCSSH